MKNLKYPTFGPQLAVLSDDSNTHGIRVQHTAHLRCRQINQGTIITASNEAMAVTMTLDLTFKFPQR